MRIEYQLEQAIALHQQGHLVRAKAAYENILKAQPEHFDALHLLGVIAIQTNQHRLAVDLIGRAIAINPNDAAFFSNRGVAFQELKLLDDAVASYDKAIAIRPGDADVYSNRGNVLQELRQLEAAVASYDKAIAVKPDYAEAHNNRGNALQGLRQLEAAVASFDRAIAVKPDYAEAHYNRGTVLQELKQLEAAVASYDKAIVIRPDDADVHTNRGNALQELKRLEAAVASYDNALAIKPDYAEAYSNRGNALQKLKQLDAAVASYDKAVAIKPDFAEAYSNRGVAMQDLKQLEAAIASFDKAVALKPDYAEAYSNRGVALQQHNQIDAALASYDKAVAINPDYAQAYLNKGMALLLKGNIEQGFELYEWRWKIEESRKDHRNFMQPLWLGQEALQNKTILLYSEQGLGDTIQFCRYTKLVADRGANVVLEVPKPLLGLLQGLAGVSEVVEMGLPLPAFDFHCPLLSLPLAYKTTLDTIPNPVAYLQSSRDKFEFWAQKLGEKTTTRVGLVWSGSTSNKHYHDRSLDLELLLPHLPGKYDYICLQKELREVDRVPLRSSTIRFFGDELYDFTDTAALCDLMDVVISIDTSVAHLSGALGKATWVLLPYPPDWRWLLDRDDSPWYPSVRLYRQNSEMTWNSVFESVKGDLLKLNSERRLCDEMPKSPSGRFQNLSEPKPALDTLTARFQTELEEGMTLHLQGQPARAKAIYENILRVDPKHFDALHLLGVIAIQENQHQLAVDLIGQAIALNSNNAAFYSNRGVALQELKNLDAAVLSYDKAIAIKSDSPETFNNRGNTLQDLKQLDAAVESFEKAIALKPGYAEAYCNRGNALQELKQLDAAVASYDKAIAVNPDHASAYWNKALALLLGGHLEQGFALYEWRWERESTKQLKRNFMQPLWLGKEAILNETILLHSEQGLGDSIQFCRYAKLLAEAGANVILEVPGPLVELLQGLAGVSKVVEQGSTLPAFDY